MHVCFICNEYPPAPHGGTGSSYRDLAEGLVAAGHKVTVIGLYYDAEWYAGEEGDRIVKGVRVVRLGCIPKWLPFTLQAFVNRYRVAQWIKRQHGRTPFDLIEASDYGGWLRFGGPPGVPTVVRIRGSNQFFDAELNRQGDPQEYAFEQASLEKADYIGAVSRYAADRTLQLCGLAHRKCRVIYNAVDMETFSPSASVPVERGLVTFVNVVNAKKGIEQLIDAMNLIWPKFPEAKLVVIGQESRKKENVERPYVEKLKERVKPEFRDRITFTGRIDRNTGVVNYLRRAHVCCYPSHMETFGIAAIEAMAMGKPTIFSSTGPGPEVLEDGVSGLLCDPFKPEDIAEKITRLFSDAALAARLGQCARERVQETFNKKDWVGRNLDFFNACINKTAPR